jgi:tetratricopeptide (TPR) repeat protein
VSASPRRCPDCGAPNPAEAVTCTECNHPLDVPDAAPNTPPAAPVKLTRPERPERVSPNVTSWGYHPRGMGGSSVPSWLWAAVGLAALVAVLVSAIQIARQPAPLAVPNADKPQLASAESLAVLLRADSTSVGPNVGLGNLYYDTGNYDLAIPYYRRALRKDPDLVDVRVDLGVSYHNIKQLELAQKELEEAVRRRPDHPVAQFDLAVVYQTMGRKEEARAHYLKAKSLDTPPQMAQVIDQLLGQLDHPTADPLPPGHPSVP